jgi:hypothetical protein
MDGRLMDATVDKVDPVEVEKGEDENDAIVKAALRLYEAAYQRDEQNILDGYDDLECRAGNQWPDDVARERVAEGRPVETINQLPQYVRQVTGDMRQMRPAIKVIPVDEHGDDESAEAMAGVVRYIENRSDAPGIYFQAADSQVACGVGAWRIVTEYAGETTFNQEVRIAPIEDALGVMWDEDAILPTREDGMECLIPIDLARTKFEKLYPDASVTDFSPRGEQTNSTSAGWSTEDKVRVGEYWFKRKTKKMMVMMPDGAVQDLAMMPPELQALIKAATPEMLEAQEIRVEKRDSCKVFRALVTASEVLEGPDEWPGSYIPIVPVIGEEIRIGRRIVRHGVIRFAKAPQRIYNYMSSAEIEVTALQPKAPFIGTEKNFEQYQDVWENANRKNYPYLPYTPDPANGNAAPQRVQPAVSSQGITAGIERAARDMQSVIGIYNASLGAASNETSGLAVMARQREGDTGTFVYIDNWTRAIKYTGKILVDLIPKIYDTARVLRIVGEDGKTEKVEINQVQGLDEQGAPRLFNDVTSGAYDVAIQMGPSYATKREEARDGMTAFMQANPNVAPIIGDLYAKSMDWPNAEDIGERLELLLPPPIRAMMAEKEGKPLPQDMQPPPPDPAQQAEMAGKMADAKAKEANARKAEADADKAQLELQALQAQNVAQMMAPPQPTPDPRIDAMAHAIEQLDAAMRQIVPIIDQMAAPPQQPPDQMMGFDPAMMTEQPPTEAAFFMPEQQGQPPQF